MLDLPKRDANLVPNMGIKIEVPDSEARRLIAEWGQRAMQLEGELAELTNAIASAEAQLNGKLSVSEDTESIPAPAKTTSGKRRKGENLRILQGFLKGIGGKGATVAEISKSTGIGPTSVQAVFRRHSEVFAKGHDGLWKLK